ncbi:MAG: ATP-dependent DNA helicase RecG [Paracoccus sp. (in: a-proteobacteria)]|uniref:ATP-dependent DNA helicase RecG n=1 Tax=Paracoccus sp. TaxID=267 RepID=UPI0032429B00
MTQPKGRPPALFPLFAGIDTLPGIGPKGRAALEQMGVERPRDLVMTLPASGITRRRIAALSEARPPEIVTIAVTILRHHPPQVRGRPWRVHCSDGTTDLTLVFFRPRENWIEGQLPAGQRRIVSGKLELFDGHAQMVHPDHILSEADPLPPAFEPVYPLSAGLTQGVMTRSAKAALQLVPEVQEWIDPQLIRERGWPSFTQALAQAHAPQSPADMSPDSPARARLAYDEFLAHQMTLALVRREKRRLKGRASAGDGRLRRAVLDHLPWPPTGAQARAAREIADDMASDRRMNRLLQGDVGAGKTLVAMLAALVAVEAGGQAVLMAPTEILARQHARALEPLARAAGIRLAALTGRDKTATRQQILTDLADGGIDILVGTHAVFQKDVHFNDLRLAIIDEQHRFGVGQRLELAAKGDVPPDMLIMTATPIPRSLALSQYGDLDVSVLDEKPPGRQPITTVMISDQRLDQVTDRLKSALAQGARAYWVCPLVDESEVSDLTAAEARFTSLRAQFGDLVRLVHGQMPTDQRDAAMADFASGVAQILVATTVIEVGVDVPQATIMVIERAESFGLSQLHQLRGRVGRGTGASTCLLMYHPPLNETGARRLTTLRDTEDGFRIAQVDLEMRGAGDVIGTAQSGLPRFRIADLEHQSGLMAVARNDARALLERDPTLDSPRGVALRHLMWLMQQDQAIRLVQVG